MKRAAAALLFAFSAAGIVACSDDAAAPPATTPAAAVACADGFAADAQGICVEKVALEACAPGTRPKIGSTRCEPVGWTTGCPMGTRADPSGWGCVDARVEPCPGDMRESASGGRCVSVGNCDALFPPAGAIVVDAAFTDAQLDATHYRTINAAVAGAPPGATIAIAAGTYAEDVRIGKSVTLEGKCPGEVKITPASTTDPGILVEKKAAGVVIRGLTVAGPHIGGINVYEGSQATIEDVVVDGAKLWGVIVDSSAATIKRSKISGTVLGPDPSGREVKGGWGIAAGASDVSIDDVNVVGGTDALFSGTSDTQMTVSRLVASGQAPQPPSRAAGVYARTGRITLERCVFHDIAGDGAIMAELPKGVVDARDTIIRDVKVAGGSRGYGVVAFAGGEVSLRNVAVLGAESVGLLARDGDSILTAFDTVVRGPAASGALPDENLVVTSERAGVGAQVTGKAKMTLDGVAIVEAWGWAIYADGGSTLDMKHSLVEGTRVLQPKRAVLPFAFGLTTSGSATTTIDDVSILRSTFHAVSAARDGAVNGRGLYVRDVSPSDPEGVGAGAAIAAGEGGLVDLDASAIFESTTSGILALDGSSRLRLTRSTIHGTRACPQGFGHGALVASEAEAFLDQTAVFDNAAIGVAASGGRALLTSAVVARNAVGVHVQRGSFVVESGDGSDLAATEVRISPDSRFLDNASKLGTGEIPLPRNVIP